MQRKLETKDIVHNRIGFDEGAITWWRRRRSPPEASDGFETRNEGRETEKRVGCPLREESVAMGVDKIDKLSRTRFSVRAGGQGAGVTAGEMPALRTRAHDIIRGSPIKPAMKSALLLLISLLQVTPGHRAQQLNMEGASLIERGRPAEAELKFREALQADPSNIDAVINLGVALFKEQICRKRAVLPARRLRPARQRASAQ